MKKEALMNGDYNQKLCVNGDKIMHKEALMNGDYNQKLCVNGD